MLKIIRKYNKFILVVGGSLLMVAFLMPQAIQQIGKARMGKSIGSMDGRKISVAQYDLAVRELRAMDGFFGEAGGVIPFALDEDFRAEHWLLLTAEARQAGLVAGAAEGETLLPILARDLVTNMYRQQYRENANNFMQAFPDQVEQLVTVQHEILARAKGQSAGSARLTFVQFDEGLAKLRGVVRLMNTYQKAERLSDRQTLAIADRLADSVLIDAVYLNARDLADKDLEPSPADLQTHFERFCDLRPGEGEFGLGYKLPPRVKLEWIELNRPAMEEAVTISLIDADKFWKQNRDRFPGEFADERESVEAELRKAEVDQVMKTAESVIRSAILTTLRPLETDGVYRVLPDNWADIKPDYIKLAEQIVSTVQERHSITLPLPGVYVRDATWLDGGMLAQLPGIGRATIKFERQQASFPQMVMQVPELVGENIFGVQLGVPAADLTAVGPDGSRYYFTPLAAAPESVPDSIGDLLNPEQLTNEWRALKRFEAFIASADQTAATVAESGLEAFAKGFGTRQVPGAENAVGPDKVLVQKNARVLENRTINLRNLEQQAEVIEGVRAKARGIDPMTPIDDVALTDRVVIVPVPGRLGVLVVQINGVEPLTRETLPTYADFALRLHRQETFQGVGVPYPFRFDILAQRHGFALKPNNDGEEIDSPSDEKAIGPETSEAETMSEG